MIESLFLNDSRLLVFPLAITTFIQTAVILTLTLGCARLLRGRGPLVRTAVFRAGLAAILCCPVISGGFRALRFGGFNVPAPDVTTFRVSSISKDGPNTAGNGKETAKQEPAGSFIDAGNPESTTATTAVLTPAQEENPSSPAATEMGAICAVVWIIGSGVLLMRLLLANVLIGVVRWRSRIAATAVREDCDSLARGLGVRTTPALLNATGISGPCLVGWIRPAILLPNDGEQVDREVLIHELAHLKRHDCLWQLLARLAASVIWFQPLIWILAREMERAAEEACDDVVVSFGGDRAAYALKLAELAGATGFRRVSAGAGLGVVGVRSLVGNRIVRLLDSNRSLGYRIGWRAMAALIVAAVVLTIGAAAIRAEPADQPRAALVGVGHQGRLVDAEGNGVEGGDVYLVRTTDSEPLLVETTKTTAGGMFVLRQSSPRSLDDRIEIQAYTPGKGLGVKLTSVDQIGDIRLEPTTQLDLTVVDPDGKHIPKMDVFPTRFVSAISPRLAAERGVRRMPTIILLPALSRRLGGTTDINGRVTLKDLPRESKFDLGFDDVRFAYPNYTKRIALSDQPVSKAASVKLDWGATISGIVRYGAAGSGVQGIDVRAQGLDRNGPVVNYGGGVTDADGRFTISHLAAGEYNVMLHLHGEFQRDWTAVAHEGLLVRGKQSLRDVDFALIKGGVIEGKVTMADSGLPISGTHVAVHGPGHPRSGGMQQAVLVAPDGSYSLRVPPGVQYVNVRGPLPEAYRQDRQEIKEVNVAEGKVAKVDFELPRQEGVAVSGTVIGLDGNPVPGVPVKAHTGGMMTLYGFTVAKSDFQGHFRFESLTPGTPIMIQHGDLSTAEPVFVQKGQGEVKLTLIRRSRLHLSGRVTDERGRPIENARIKLTQWFGNHGFTDSDPHTSDPNGRYQLHDLFADNQYSIEAEADGFGIAFAKLRTDENSKELPTLVLARVDSTTGGTVVDWKGNPVEGITVHLNDGVFPKSTVTDAKGRFSFQVVSGDGHMIWVASKTAGKVGPIAIGMGGTENLVLRLPRDDQ